MTKDVWEEQNRKIAELEQQLEHSKEMEKQSEAVIKDLSEGYDVLEAQNLALMAACEQMSTLIKKSVDDLYNHCDSSGAEHNWDSEVCHIATIAKSLEASTVLHPSTDDVAAMKAAIAEANKWRIAVENELVLCHIWNATHADPEKALRDAIQWNVDVALDPQVSEISRQRQIELCEALADNADLREKNAAQHLLLEDYGVTYDEQAAEIARMREALSDYSKRDLRHGPSAEAAAARESGEWQPELGDTP